MSRKKKQPARQNTTVNNVRKAFQHNDNEIIEENDSEITRPPPQKNKNHKINDHLVKIQQKTLDTDNDNITEPRLTPPLPITNKRLSNNERFEELDNNNQVSQKSDKLQGITSEFEATIWLAKHPPLDISSSDKTSLITSSVGSCFDDYCYHLLAKLRKKAGDNNIPTDAQLLEFILEDIWYEILCQFLEAIEQHVLRHNKNIWNALGDFVHEAIKKIIASKLEETDMKIALCSCDAITVNLQIPTVLGVVTR
ncbi:22157_t:CDS:2 [Gigaspora margarita]|uniref:22157_t:CDS:1 n=1 Tax=Gigaspora margarita TaxID=4874 RepID=A0ABN7UM91_GIGMA|nr:22157_t:CDS:2 [Gigaspora margarita]